MGVPLAGRMCVGRLRRLPPALLFSKKESLSHDRIGYNIRRLKLNTGYSIFSGRHYETKHGNACLKNVKPIPTIRN